VVGTRIETAPAQSPGWRGGAGPLAILPRVLFRDERPWLAILVGWLLTIAGSTLIGWIVARIAPDNSGPDFGDVSGATKLFLIALFSPVVETLIMAGVLSLLLRFLRPWHAVVASALLWGIAHSLSSPWWGVVIWWPFLIFSTSLSSRGIISSPDKFTTFEQMSNCVILIAPGTEFMFFRLKRNEFKKTPLCMFLPLNST
jgi:hypothetical protein